MEPVLQLCGVKGCANAVIPALFVEVEVYLPGEGWGQTRHKVMRVEVCEDHGLLMGAVDAVA